MNAKIFDQNMWEGFSGAEAWDEGHQPVYREVNEYLLVADKNGVECYANVENFDVFRALDGLPSQALAMALLNGLPEDFNPTTYGFEFVTTG